MVLMSGEKVHVIHRQLFDGDTRRHFVGTVESCDGALARVTGYLFAMDGKLNQFVKRDSLRTRIIPLVAPEVIVNVLPEHVEIDKITYAHRPGSDIAVSDGSTWHLDLTHL
jgi:hypothetical protein